MNRWSRSLAFAGLCVAGLLLWIPRAHSQAAQTGERKNLQIDLPTEQSRSQSIGLSAISMQHDLSGPGTQTVHLQGSVSIVSEINRAGGGIVRMTVQADAADYDERTGEITPRGNVRIKMEQR